MFSETVPNIFLFKMFCFETEPQVNRKRSPNIMSACVNRLVSWDVLWKPIYTNEQCVGE